MITPPPLPKEPFDPSPSSNHDDDAPARPSLGSRAVSHAMFAGKIGAITIVALQAAAVIAKQFRPSLVTPIDSLIELLKGL